MGSKSHDVYSLQISHICSQNVDLFKKNLVQFSVYSNKSTDIFKGLLKNSQRPVNLKIFERLGFTAKVYMTEEILTDTAIFFFIKNQVDDAIKEIDTWCFFPYNHLNVIDQLKNNQSISIDSSDVETFTAFADGNEIRIDIPSIKQDRTKYYVIKSKQESDSSEIPAMGKSVNDSSSGIYIYFSKTKNDSYNSSDTSNISLQIEYKKDSRATIYVKYTDKNGNKKEWIGFDSIVREAITTEVLGIVLKNNGSILNETKKMHIALSNLGIKYEDIKNNLHSSTLKSFFITYATKNKNYHFFSKRLNDMYRANNNVTINIGGNVFKYHYISHEKDDNVSSEYVLSINTSDGEGVEYKPGDSEFFYFIPLNWVKELTLKERYQFVRECLVAIAYSHDVVHTKWFESGFFRFALMVATTFLTGNPALAISMTIASEIIASTNLSPELKQAILITASIAVGSYNGSLKEPSLTISDIARISIDLGKYYFKNKTENIFSQIKEYSVKEKQIEDTIQKIKNQSIFIPMEQIGSYYDLQYSLLYNFNDLYYNTVNESTINDKNLI